MNFKNALTLWAAALFVTTGAFAQVKKKPAAAPAHKTTNAAVKQPTRPTVPTILPTDPDVIVGKLPNGLKYYIRANSLPKNRAELYLVSKAGSVLETDAQQGLANFIQRMAFKSTRDFPKDELTSYLQSTGAKFGPGQSAYTSYDETVYQLSVRTDTTAKVFGRAFNLLANWAAYMTFDQADINAEKTLAAQEAQAGGKTPQERLQDQTLPLLLNNSRYAVRNPIGKESTINTFNLAAVKGFYNDWYRPDMQAIIAVGDFDPKAVEAFIVYNFTSLRNPAAEKPLPQFSTPIVAGTAVKFATEKDFPYTMAQIVVKHPQTTVITPADFLQNMRIALFNQMMSTRINDVVQTQPSPLTYGQANYGSFAGNQNAFTALAVAGPAGLETAFKAIVAETERARRFGFVLTELERTKQAVLEQMANSYKLKDIVSSNTYASNYEHNFLTGDAIPGLDYEYTSYINNIGKITVADMNALAEKIITDQNRVVLIEAPETEKAKLPSEQTVLNWMAEAGTDLTAYVDNYNTDPLLNTIPQAGKVTSLKVDSSLLVTNVTLANGVKIILKPTTFKTDQILINGYSFGGTSLASDQDFTSVSLINDVISNSGVAGYTQSQVNDKLRGKSLSISPYISDVTQGVSGYSSPADFGTAMQLLYLYFTAPRKDAEAWKSTVSRAQSIVSHKGTDPGSVYQDTVLAVLNSYNPRAMPVTAAQLSAADLDKAYEFYKARFADASGFTFTFTGYFSIDAIMPFLMTYLGSLPSTNSNETYKNLGIHPPVGKITKTVYKGTSDKATVQLVYSGAYDYNDANNVQMDALEEVLNIRLADSLKKESGVYSSGVRISYIKIPEGRYKVTLSFLCDAGNVDKATAYLLAEIDKIKTNGPLPNDVQKFVIRDARSTQAQLRENTFWEANLTSASQNQQDPDRILMHVQDLGNVTAQSVKDTANKYLNNNNLIKLILLPEKK